MREQLEQLGKRWKELEERCLQGFKDLGASLNTGVHPFVENVMDEARNPTPKSKLFPYTYYDKKRKFYFCDDGTAGFGFECVPIVGYDVGVLKQLSGLFDDMLPLGGVLQVLLIASDELEEILRGWQEERIREDEISTFNPQSYQGVQQCQ